MLRHLCSTRTDLKRDFERKRISASGNLKNNGLIRLHDLFENLRLQSHAVLRGVTMDQIKYRLPPPPDKMSPK